MLRTLLHYRNLDSTLDLNDQFSKFFKRGIVQGGELTPVAGQLAVDVAPFKLIGIDGMAVQETSDATRIQVTAGLTSVIVFKSQYVPNSDPIAAFEAIEISAYNARLDKDFLCVFGTVSPPILASQVQAGDISLDLRDVVDPIGRLNIRGSLTSDSQLPTQNNRPADTYIVTSGAGDTPTFYVYNGVEFVNITNTLAVASLLAAHRANLFPDEKHLTDEQEIAATGTEGQPGVEVIGATFDIPNSRVILAETLADESLQTAKVVRFATTGNLPAPLTPGQDYYVILIDQLTFRVALTPTDAVFNNFITFSGLQSGVHEASFEENKYVTSTDERLPSKSQAGALDGFPAQPVPSGSNPYVTAAYTLAEPNAKAISATGGPITLNLGEGPFYVGIGGAGTPAQYFQLYHSTLQREYIDPTSQVAVQISGVFKDNTLTQPLIPSGEPAVIANNGFYTGALYLSLSSPVTAAARLLYGQQKQLDQIDRGAFLRPTISSAQTSQEAVLRFQEIAGRLFDQAIPANEQNINLRIAINALLRYLVSNTAANLVLSRSEFPRLRNSQGYAADFPLTTGEVEVLSGNRNFNEANDAAAITAFDPVLVMTDAPFCSVITYTAAAALASVQPGHLFVDGVGARFRILAKNAGANKILIYTGGRAVSNAVSAQTGRILQGNNPRQVEMISDHQTQLGIDFIPADDLIDLPNETEEIPPGGNAVGTGALFSMIGQNVLPNQGSAAGAIAGRTAYAISPKIQNNRIEDRVRLYGNWKSDQDNYPRQVIGDVSAGSCAIEFTGRVNNVLLFSEWKGQTPYNFRIFINGVYTKQMFASALTEDTLTAQANADMEVFLAGRPKLQPISLDLNLPTTQISTVRIEITTAGIKPFALSAVGAVVNQGLTEEAGNVFIETDYASNAAVSNVAVVQDNRQLATKFVRYIDAVGKVRLAATKDQRYFADPNKIFTGNIFTIPGGVADPLFPSQVGDVLFISDRAISNLVVPSSNIVEVGQDIGNTEYKRVIAQNAGSRTLESAIAFNSTHVEYAFKVPTRPSDGAAVVGSPKSNDKEYARLKVSDWSAGLSTDISELPTLSQESRVTILEDGSTALRTLDVTRVEVGLEGFVDGLEMSTAGSEMQMTAFCTRMDVVFAGSQGACAVTVTIDNKYSYTINLKGDGVERHSLFYSAGLQSHTVKLSAPTGVGKVVVAEWIMSELADPQYNGVAISEYNLLRNSNSKLFPEVAKTDTLAISNNGMRLIDPVTFGAKFFGSIGFTAQDSSNPMFGSSVTLNSTDDGFTFYIYGTAFEISAISSGSTNLNVFVDDQQITGANFPNAKIFNSFGPLGGGFRYDAGVNVRAGMTDLVAAFHKIHVRFSSGSPIRILAIGYHAAVGSVLRRNAEDTQQNRLHFSSFKDLRKFLTLEPQQVGLVGGAGEATAVTELTETDSEDLVPLPTYRAVVKDDFSEAPTAPDSKVDSTLTKAPHNFNSSLYRMSYAQSTLVGAGTLGTTLQLAAMPAYPVGQVEVNNIAYFVTQNKWRKINAIPTAGVPIFTLDAAVPNGFADGQTVIVMQAVYSKDLVNLGDATELTRLRDLLSGQENKVIHLSYLDSAATGDATTPVDTVADYQSVAHVVGSASNQGLGSDVGFPLSTTFGDIFQRPPMPQDAPDYPLPVNANQERLFVVFFPNPTNLGGLSGVKNLLEYRADFYQHPTFQSAGVLDMAYCYNDGSGSELNCKAPVNVLGLTEIELNFSYIMGINPGLTRGDVLPLVDGKVVPRFVNGVTSPTDLYFIEVTPNRLRFSQDIITGTPRTSIEIARIQGNGRDTSSTNTSRIAYFADLLVGSPEDVAAGIAHYSSLQAAHDAAIDGQRIHIRSLLTIVENVTISKRLTITGNGYDSFIDGTITCSAACDFSIINKLRAQTVVLQSGADGNFLTECYVTVAPTNNGTANIISVVGL